MSRPTCTKCKKNVCAINYKRANKVHYRSKCRSCIAQEKQQKDLATQLFNRSGYVKRKNCDRCGFISKHQSQMKLVFLDDDKLNVSRSNLRTYCLNCVAELSSLPAGKRSELVPDY